MNTDNQQDSTYTHANTTSCRAGIMLHFPKITQSLLPITHPKLECLLHGGQMGSLSFQPISCLNNLPFCFLCGPCLFLYFFPQVSNKHLFFSERRKAHLPKPVTGTMPYHSDIYAWKSIHPLKISQSLLHRTYPAIPFLASCI